VTVRAGILGTGWIAQEHAIALAGVPEVEVVRDAAMAPDLVLPPGHPFGWRDALGRNLASVYAAIGGEKPSLPFATFEDGHRSLVLLEAVINSSTTGSRVSVPAARNSIKGRNS
jgi:predicted dehydrogenase